MLGKIMLWGCTLESSLRVLVLLRGNYKRELRRIVRKETCLSLRVHFVNNVKRSEKVESTYCTKCFIVPES